jgi:hypothetical protein
MRTYVTGPRLAFLASALSTVLAAPPARANLVVNGDFEAPQIAPVDFVTLPAIPGWTGLQDIEIQNRIAGSPFSGNQHVELDTNFNSGMFQNIPTIPGETYSLSFAYSPRPEALGFPGVPADSAGIDIFWGGQLVTSLALSGEGLLDTQWQVFTFTVFGGPGAATGLRFNAAGISDSFGGYVDAVSVVGPAAVVPEPGTRTLFSIGMLSLIGSGYLRRGAVIDSGS